MAYNLYAVLYNQSIIKMKKLLLLFLGLTMLSCSSDDSPSATNPPASNTVEIVSYDYELHESTTIGKLFEFTATVKNNTSNTVTGKVVFKVDKGNTQISYTYINDVTIEAVDTKTVSVVDGYFDTQTLNITEVSFVQD